jgi:hypothetical protein
MDITIVTTARTDDEGRALLRAFGFPFRTADSEQGATAKPRKKRGPVRGGKGGKRR